jgi:hypothetical protein
MSLRRFLLSSRHPPDLRADGSCGAIVLAVLVAHHVTHDGESTRFEGLQLLGLYAVLGLVFFFV